MSDANITASPPEWLPHENPCYDSILGPACDSELGLLRKATSKERLEFICDPREVHRSLYESLAPPTHKEYAGTFRGTPNTTLVARRAIARKITDDDHVFFEEPSKVAASWATYCQMVKTYFEGAKGIPKNNFLKKAVEIFYFVGRIHPFLDGNGHIQRLIFAAYIFERPELELLSSWTIHPRPYDENIALAFEGKNVINDLTQVLSDYIQ